MRKTFVKELEIYMKQNDKIWVLVGDLGSGVFDKIRESFPKRFVNCGVAEQNMIGVAAGLALSGKIPFVYSITPFLLFRPYEFIRNLVDYDKNNVKLIASGRGNDYDDHNYSHLSPEEKQVLKSFKNIKSIFPEHPFEIPGIVSEAITTQGPYYINLKRRS